MKFGSEELHLALRAARDANDLTAAAELLYEPVCRTARFLFARKAESFRMYTREDRDDAMHDALVYMLERLDAIACPPNEGVPSYSYYANFVYNGLCQRRRKLIRIVGEISMNAPISGSGNSADDKEQTLLCLLHARKDQPESDILLQEEVNEALRDFFALSNEPVTLAAVGLIILSETLGAARMSLREYVEYLNGTEVSTVLNLIEHILAELELDVHALDPVRKRLNTAEEGTRFSGLTEAKLANRKNSIISKLQNARKPKK